MLVLAPGTLLCITPLTKTDAWCIRDMTLHCDCWKARPASYVVLQVSMYYAITVDDACDGVVTGARYDLRLCSLHRNLRHGLSRLHRRT